MLALGRLLQLRLLVQYLTDRAVDIDLVVVGAWDGRGRRGGLVSQFLLACPSVTEPGVYWTVAKVRRRRDMCAVATTTTPRWAPAIPWPNCVG